MLIPYKGKTPNVHDSVFIAPGAYLIGDVTIGKESSVWFNAVLRGDEGPIIIGEKCSIQDNVTIHLYEDHPTIIKDGVTVGHNVILHGCKIGRPPRSLVVGSPGKVVRELSDHDFMLIQGSIEVYVQKGKEYIDILSQLKNK